MRAETHYRVLKRQTQGAKEHHMKIWWCDILTFFLRGTRRTSTWGLGRSWRHSLGPRFSLVGNRLIDSTKHLMSLGRRSSVAPALTNLVRHSGMGLVATAAPQPEAEAIAKDKPPCEEEPASNPETNGKTIHVDNEPSDTLVEELDQLTLEDEPVPVAITIEQFGGLDRLLRYCGQKVWQC